jgi:hypothetical protein
MLRTITLVTALLAYVVSAQAQGMKFGVHVDPQISILGSNDNDVTAAGANIGFSFGVEGEYYFQDGENYALTFGAGFAFNKGGRLNYRYATRAFLSTELDRAVFRNEDNEPPAIGATGIALTENSTIRYSANVVEIPIGLKLRTNELGDSYLRAFFHLPLATFGIPVAARANITAETPSDEEILYAGTSNGENIYSDINFIQISLGTGAGVEYSPNAEGGLRLIGGLYYNYNFIDMTKRVEMRGFEDNNFTVSNPTNGFHNVALRIGVIF